MRQSLSFRPAVEGKNGGVAPAGGPVRGAAGDGCPVVEQGLVVAQPLDLAGLLASAHHPGAGAVVLFSGEVRENNRGREVDYLEYEAHVPLAEKTVAEILAAVKVKWGLSTAIAQHRIGRVEIGETAVVVITASPHRSEAYTANRYIIDRIKHEAPIWKCEHYRDGTKEWGNNCNCAAITGDVSKHVYESGL